MKVSAFAQSDARGESSALSKSAAGPRRSLSVGTKPALIFVFVVGALYLGAHVPFLAPSLEDIDSINFALGLRHFDPASHQPHPPGYPVYIALGRVSLAVLTSLFPSISEIRAEALALSIWSALGGFAAIIAAWLVYRALDRFRQANLPAVNRDTSALWAVLLLALTPLFWVTGLRPMSDMPGLAISLAAQALLLSAIQGRASLVPGALVTGIAAGLRAQSLMLTVPLLAWGIVVELRTGGWRSLIWPAVGLVAGISVWAIPLIAAAGGVSGYIDALGLQAGEDFGWVNMLWSNPSPRRLAFALYETFALPWASMPLAVLFGGTAILGAVVMFVRAWRALIVVCVAFGPYLIFHLLFQETPFVRYALPLIPAITWLSAQAIAAGASMTLPVGILLAIYAGSISVPAGILYGSELHPAFRAIGEMTTRSRTSEPAAVYSHYSLFRPLQATPTATLKIVPPSRVYEWLGPVEYWRGGGTQPIWFLADSRRTDLALVDPQSRRDRVEYRWSVSNRPELQGTRPLGVDWYRLTPPGWFAGEGWSLTAETGGLVRATGKGVNHRPIEAFVKRRLEPVTIMVGGRHLGPPSEPPTELRLSLDDKVVDEWVFDHHAEGPNFLRFVRLPGGIPAGPGEYARLTISARAAINSQPTPEVAIRQFDVQSGAYPILGFGEGWHEDEYDVSKGLHWRWTSDRSTLRIVSERSVVLTMRGESPLKYFDAPPTVRFKLGARILAAFHPDADFEWRIKVSSDALKTADGVIVIETDRVYLPAESEGTADTRRLGLRVFDWRAEPSAD